MSHESCENLDPRIRRTRQLLQQALDRLLQQRDFDKISVQDITQEAMVNRATFYGHYPDKFALLECLVAARFYELLTQRGLTLDNTCGTVLQAMVLAVCDYVMHMRGTDGERALEPHMELAIISIVRKMVLEGLNRHRAHGDMSLEMRAAAASWAIYGAVKEWTQTPGRCAADEMAGTVMALISPLLTPHHKQEQVDLGVV